MAETNGLVATRSNRSVASPFIEIGSTGLRQYGGRLQEEHLRAWKPQNKAHTIRQMQTDAIISASLLVYNMLIRQVSWEIQAPPEDSWEMQESENRALAKEHAEFARQVWLEDMSYSWREIVSEILTMLSWGHCFMEIAWKRRKGDSRVPAWRSLYTDGKIGIRKLAMRAQDTLTRWEFDEEGGVRGVYQWDQHGPHKREVFIPIEKALLFRTGSNKGSPEGSSLLRSSHVSWYQKINIAQIQGIGIEMDATGLPVVRIPGYIMTDPTYAATFDAYKRIATNLNTDAQRGLVIPSDRDEHGQYFYDVSLISTTGTKQFDTTKVLQALNLEIVLSLLTDVILIGHERAGSFALRRDTTSMLSTALGGFMDIITEVVNRHGMPRLWRLNGLPTETMPRMVHGDVEHMPLEEIANYVLKLTQAGLDITDLENEVRRRTGFPLKELGKGGESTTNKEQEQQEDAQEERKEEEDELVA